MDGRFFLLIALVDRVGLFKKPTGREHKIAKNGWKLSKVAIIGSTWSFLAKTGEMIVD